MPKPKRRLEELDALRGIASLAVVLFHFTMFTPYAEWGFKLGVTGVDLFFMISAFVIFMSIEKIKKKPLFLINRLSRMYPTYWASVIFTAVLIVLYNSWKGQSLEWTFLRDVTVNLTMFQQYFEIENLDSPYWTMILEMSFYLGMYLLFITNTIRYLFPIFIAIIVVLAVITLNSPHHLFLIKLYQFVPFLAFLPLFLAGIIFYNMRFHGTKQYYWPLLIFCILSQLAMLHESHRADHNVGVYENMGMLIAYFSLFALFVYDKLQFIVNPVTLFLGKVSFPLYLTHFYISNNFIFPFLEKFESIGFWLSRLVGLVVVVSIAYFFHITVESKSTQKMRSFLRGVFNL